MSLEKTFREVKKSPVEKKLEVITSKGVVLDELLAHFEQNKFKGLHWTDECREYLSSCLDFLKSFELSPEMIAQFHSITNKWGERKALGFYLSALIQASYNQGFNNFVFEEVNSNDFGVFLKGQPENLIRIEVKELKGWSSLYCAENCALTAENIKAENSLPWAQNCALTVKNLKGDYTLENTNNCSLTAETITGNYTLFCAKDCMLKIKTLKGYNTLIWAENCLAEITNYQEEYFGKYMKNCVIKSGNKETLELIKKQIGERGNNKFELKK